MMQFQEKAGTDERTAEMMDWRTEGHTYLFYPTLLATARHQKKKKKKIKAYKKSV